MSKDKQVPYYWEVKGRDGIKRIATLYVKGELYNADGTPAKFIGEGADALTAYHSAAGTKKVGRRPKNL